jgi:YVTN family beta-propeller protein
VGNSPVGIAFSPDGTKLLVTNLVSSNVTAITLGNLTTEEVFVGSNPVDIAITPDQAPVASFTATIAPTSSASSFDASDSISPIGSIASYNWDFGDGTTVSTPNPIIEHSFIDNGSLLVTLRVTNSGGTSSSQTFTGSTVSNNGGPSALFSQLFDVGSSIGPPSQASGVQIANRFCVQKDYINQLTWQPPLEGEAPVEYAIYRDSALTDLIALTSRTEYNDHNRRPGEIYIYYIVSIGTNGDRSVPVVIVVPS